MPYYDLVLKYGSIQEYDDTGIFKRGVYNWETGLCILFRDKNRPEKNASKLPAVNKEDKDTKSSQ